MSGGEQHQAERQRQRQEQPAVGGQRLPLQGRRCSCASDGSGTYCKLTRKLAAGQETNPLPEPVPVQHQGRSAGGTTHTSQLSRFCRPSQLGPPCVDPTAQCLPKWLPAALDHACLMPANSACSGRWRRLDRQNIQLNAAKLESGIVTSCFGGPKRGLSEAVHACGGGGGGRGGGSSSATVPKGASGPRRAAPPSCTAMAGERLPQAARQRAT
jgi:hypothetical protein